MTPRKKQHLAWHKDLKKALEQIVWCERCGNNALILDIANSKKRYDIRTKDDYFTAAKLCRDCHLFVETGKHDRMENLVTEIIKNRSVDTMTA